MNHTPLFEFGDGGRVLVRCLDKHATTAVIPEGVTVIGNGACDGCTRLTPECIVWPGFSHGSSPWTNISR